MHKRKPRKIKMDELVAFMEEYNITRRQWCFIFGISERAFQVHRVTHAKTKPLSKINAPSQEKTRLFMKYIKKNPKVVDAIHFAFSPTFTQRNFSLASTLMESLK